MGRMGRCPWDDGQVMGLVAQVLDRAAADCDPPPRSSAGGHRPAELSLIDVVEAGRAAFVWLDVLALLRHVPRHQGPTPGLSTRHEPGHRLGGLPTGGDDQAKR